MTNTLREAVEEARAEFASGDSIDYEEYARTRRGVTESYCRTASTCDT